MPVSILAAIVFSPVIAVVITLWWEKRKVKHEAKYRVFIALMAHRKSYPISHERVNALNLIDTIFGDCPKVLAMWHEYYSMLQRQNPSPQEQVEQHQKYIELLSEMAGSLGFSNLKQTDIDKFYIPQAHMDQAQINAECQAEFLRVLKNTERLPVVPKPAPPTPPRDILPHPPA